MKQFLGVLLATVLLSAPGVPGRAEDKDDKAPPGKAILDKAIKALGGEAKLAKAKAVTWKAKGTITFNDEDNAFTSQATFAAIDRYRGEFTGTFGGNKVKGVTVVDGKKGWRKFGDMGGEMDSAALANEKRTLYLRLVPVTLLQLKGKGFKIERGEEKKVGEKPAVGLKVTGPDGKDFRIYFDKASGLPVQVVAKVRGFMGEEFTQETTLSGYKEMGGIKKATKLESKRDGEKFISEEITEFKTLEKVDPKTFDEPK
jgi:hypothetical protein